MRRIAMIAAAALLAAGCGSDSNSPAVSQVTVTVRQGGVALPGATVVECGVVDQALSPPACTVSSTITSQETNASGQATFNVPSSTTSGQLCFSVTVGSLGGYSHTDDCKTLNALTPTVTLELL
ncbi:MAG TPA: hypothetical protein PLL32_05060 [Anaeromyxobacteraceae bacterium]|nr:hypothetical protein [Anaeromyxobacteraceae bacterium]